MTSFVSVADSGSFSVAANRLGLTQSTVSKQIAALEAHLTARLFHRTTRSLALTNEGSAFYESVQRALAAIDEAQASIGPTAEVHGLLRVTMPLTLAESRLIAIIADFLADNSQLQIDLSVSDHPLNLVADNIDIALRVGRLVDSNLVARKIGTTHRVLVASPAYLAKAGRPQAINDLVRHNCVLYSLSSSGSRWMFASGEAVQVSGNFRASSPNALRAAALAGIGIALNARWLFEREIESGALEIVLAEHEPEQMPIQAVLPSGRYIATRTRLFLDYVAAALARDPLTRAP
ncbi:MAG: LysR family transcriptional regulator [Sphingomonadaceae bacterium]